VADLLDQVDPIRLNVTIPVFACEQPLGCMAMEGTEEEPVGAGACELLDPRELCADGDTVDNGDPDAPARGECDVEEPTERARPAMTAPATVPTAPATAAHKVTLLVQSDFLAFLGADGGGAGTPGPPPLPPDGELGGTGLPVTIIHIPHVVRSSPTSFAQEAPERPMQGTARQQLTLARLSSTPADRANNSQKRPVMDRLQRGRATSMSSAASRRAETSAGVR
jgi:hypothetical protein